MYKTFFLELAFFPHFCMCPRKNEADDIISFEKNKKTFCRNFFKIISSLTKMPFPLMFNCKREVMQTIREVVPTKNLIRFICFLILIYHRYL